jgi:hypothetical protein
LAQKAAGAHDAAGVRAAVLEWGTLPWSDNAPLSIGEFASRVEAPLSDELRRLSSASYGRHRGEFNGDALASALRSISVRTEHAKVDSREPLPPLMPPTS